MVSKYQAVLDNIRKERCSNIVKELYEAAGITLPAINKRYDTEEQSARAVLIWLAISAFDISIKSDIVLCAFGLLDEYSEIQGVQQRREKFFIDSNYAFRIGKKLVYAADLSDDQLDYQAKQFNKTDGPLLHELIEYFKGIQDKVGFYREACERYLEIPAAGYPFRVAKLPRPSFALTFDKPVRYIKHIKNADFCGREDILQALENGFSSKREHRVQILHGMAGVGKTQIALAYAYSHQDEYGTIVWIDASDYSTLNRECLNCLRENDDYSAEKPTIGEIRVRFLNFLSQRSSLLLILDNVDYLDGRTDSTQKMKEKLLRYIPARNGHVIITTRCNSNFSGAAQIPVSVFSPELALQFLEKQTGQKTDDTAKLLAEKLGYLPLALAYTVAYIRKHTTYKGYLELWDKYSIKLFDQQGYTERTVRQVFEISLNQIQNDAPSEEKSLTSELLNLCAVLNAEHLPLKLYIDYMLERLQCIEAATEKMRECGAKVTVYEPDVEDKTVFLRQIDNELVCNNIVRRLTDYSLAEYLGGCISVHTMLREIVYDRMTAEEKQAWKIFKSDSDLAAVFERYGDKKQQHEHEHKTLADEVAGIRTVFRLNISILKRTQSMDRSFFASDADLFQRLLQHGDRVLIRQYLLLRREVVRELCALDEELHCTESERKATRRFYESIAKHLGRQVVYRNYNTPKERSLSGKRYYYEKTGTNVADLGDQATAGAREVVDIWLDEADAESELSMLVENERRKWWVIVTRHGRKFCVSDIRQRQEWRCGNRAESGELSLGHIPPGGAPRYARRRRECRGAPPGTLRPGEFASP